MRTHEVYIDHEVYVFLQEHARPFEDSVNDVLRRLLLEPGNIASQEQRSKSPDDTAQRRLGDLMPLIELSLLQSGDELVHEQPRKGIIQRATVTEDGWVRAKDQDFSKVSPALKACVGHEINGWRNWTHRTSGRSLQELREELRRMQDGSR
ncbi:hypothetical protein [Amycolatopsis sp. WAC 01376]|uniref:restriction system modified-DNA reader domain-containing protein n=1 Tax=Amycolatopsis sp. WAC 01376 TaxID=2203195 RepID=UPI000F78E13E|nr:hypothetical protein [Amycolatopsis sp. WAC 01376]